MKITSSNVIRFSGLALVPAGIVLAGIQPIHPPDVVESVSTTAWAEAFILPPLAATAPEFVDAALGISYGHMAIAAALTPLAALLPHAEQRYAAARVALALAWLGYALWSERRTSASQLAPATGGAQLHPAATK